MDLSMPAMGRLCVAFLGIILLLVPPQSGFGQPSREGAGGRNGLRGLGIREAISIAVARNLRMADARLAVEEKEHRRRQAFSAFFPTVDLAYSGQWSRYRDSGTVGALASAHDSRRPAVPGVGPDYPYRIDPYRTFSLTATMTQPLYTGGKYLNEYKYARLGVDYSQLQFEVERQDLTLDVTEAYYELVQAEKLLEVANQSIRALEALRNQTIEFYKAGVAPKVDVLATEGQLAQARIQKTQALTDIANYAATLNFLLRYPQETPVRVVQDIAYRPNAYSIPGIYSVAAANRIEIRQANISVEQAMALVKASKAELLPRVDVQASVTRLNDDWNPFDPEAVQDPGTWSLQGVLTWTFDMFALRETVQERRTTQARAFVARELLVEQVMEEVKTAFMNMKRSEADIADNRKAVEYRTENFRINRERYKEQVATYIEVLDAQRQLAQAEGDYYISLVGYRINQAILERSMGTLR